MLIVAGLVALLVGAEFVVRGGTRVARRMGVSPMVIGLTIVSITTSAPELAIGIDSALAGAGDIAIGNIAGTNLVNLMLILGLSALIRPLPLRVQTVRLDLPLMALAAVELLAMTLDRTLSRLDGVLLLLLAVCYTATVVQASRGERRAIRREYAEENPPPSRRQTIGLAILELGTLLAGVAVVVLGADWLVTGAVDLAQRYGVSDALIGLTIVAVGTSAPELATTLISTIRNHRDVAIGNLIGSSVYNIALILGLTALVSPDGIPVTGQLVRVDLPVMAAAVLVCVPAFIGGRRLTRLEGGLFVSAYLGYLGYLVLARV